MNSFCHYLDRLPTQALRANLALLCSQPRYSRGFASEVMADLEKLGLIRQQRSGWQPTWLGYGVNNWHRQLECSLHLDPTPTVPEPREGENGKDLGPECDDFRELFFRPGFCWCTRPAGLHPRHLPKVATDYLRWHNENEGWKEDSKRCLVSLLAELTSVERAVLEQVGDLAPTGVHVAELAGCFACLIDYSTLKTAVRHLLRLGLLESKPDLILTWDGRGLVRYMTELIFAREQSLPLDDPRPGENGVDPLHSPCPSFRALLSQPDSCWCGWNRESHAALELP